MDENLIFRQTELLAQFLYETNFEDLPREVVERAKLIFADTVGIAFCGSNEPEMERLYRQLPKGETAVLLKRGLPRTDDLSMAGFANATAICFVELDTFSPPSGHAPLHLLPPLLALAQALGKSGKELLTAFVLGYEVHHRLNAASTLRPGFYVHGNSGQVAAAAAVGKLLGFHAEQINQAVVCAASLTLATSWPVCLTDSTISSVFASFSTPMALTVAKLVESGFTGYGGALGHTFGELIGSEFDAASLTKDLGVSYSLMNNCFKFHSTCGVLHPAIEAAADALGYTLSHDQYPPFQANCRINAEDITSVRVYSGDVRLPPKDFSPTHKQAAKFSLPFALAAYLVAGNANPETIHDELLCSEQVRALEKRIHLEFDPQFQEKNGGTVLAKVRIEFADGSSRTGKCEGIYGRAANPANEQDVYHKFQSLIGACMAQEEKEKLWNQILRMDTLEKVDDLFLAIH